jgi:Ca-activated chloride channel homolog
MLLAVAGLVGSVAAMALLAAALPAEPVEVTVAGKTFTAAEPRWLAVLGCAPYVVMAALLSVGDAPRGRRLMQAGLRFVFLTVLGLTLARPATRREERAVSVVALVDVSTSITDGQLAEEREFAQRLARAAEGRGRRAAEVRVVRFAAQAEELAEGAAAAIGRAPGKEGQETDLAAAIGLGLGLVDSERVARLVLLSDGRATRGDATAEAARAAARGVRILHRAPAGAAGRDVAVLRLHAPEDIRPHATFPLAVELLSTHAGTARVRLLHDGQPHAPEPEQQVVLAPGVTTVRWQTRVDRPGMALYRAELVRADDNGRRENDAGILAVVPRPEPRVLVLQAGGPPGLPLLRALDAEGFATESRRPRALEEGAAAAVTLADVDLLVLSDVPKGALSAGQQEMIARFVRDGGGLLVAGGPDSFGSGGYGASRLGSLLPVEQDPTDQREEATLALALVIDRSGSMSGPKMELTKEAARGTAQMLAPDDLISVVVFDSQAHSVVRMQPASNRQRILNDIAQIRASGGTNILPGLREGFDQLLAARARKKHVIVLSDGQSPYEGIPELIDDAAAAHITVSAVGVGEGADQTLLQMIATRSGGRFYHARDPASIPQIFTRETQEISRSSIVEQPTRIRVAKTVQMLSGLPLDSAPPLRGYTRTRARREAEVLLSVAQGDPLLARWQVGLGQVAAWTSDLGHRWASELARWPSYAKLAGQLGRSIMRRSASNSLPVRARLVGDRVFAEIEAAAGPEPGGGAAPPSPAPPRPAEGGGAPAGLGGMLEVTEVEMSASAPASAPTRTRRVTLSEPVPGRYEADFPLGAGGGALLLSARLGGGAALVHAHGRLGVPHARELLPDPQATGRALLQALAERTGGRRAETPEMVLDAGSDRVVRSDSWRVPLLLLALALFLADVAVRRVRFRGS